MKSIAIKGLLKKQNEYFIIVPATKADKMNLNIYADAADGKYLNIVMKSGSGTKTYSQLKTAYALFQMYFIANKGRKPTSAELKLTHDYILEHYGEKKEVQEIFGEQTKTVVMGLSEYSKQQLARLIQTLIQLLHENTQEILTSADDLIDLGDLFTEWEEYLSLQKDDPTDFNENGEYLSLDEYRATHTVSYASGRTCGIDGSPLEMAHIISKGSDPAFENCCWNVMMLTHEEHVGIMHSQEIREGGWNALIARYPHIRGRVERAYALAKHLYRIMEKEGIEL